MRVVELLWDDEADEHLAKHGVNPRETEEVCRSHPFILRTRAGRYIILGRSESGRYLTVIAAPLGRNQVRLITARAMTESERRRYLQR